MNQRTTIFLAVIFVLSFSNRVLADDRFNVTSNVFGNVVGVPNIELSFKAGNHLTLGFLGSSGRTKLNDMNIKVSTVGMIARLYYQPAFQNDSWYIVGSLDKRTLSADVRFNEIDYQGSLEKNVSSGGIGYHWFWTSFNISLGIMTVNQPKLYLIDSGGNRYKDSINSDVGIDFTIGGKF